MTKEELIAELTALLDIIEAGGLQEVHIWRCEPNFYEMETVTEGEN